MYPLRSGLSGASSRETLCGIVHRNFIMKHLFVWRSGANNRIGRRCRENGRAQKSEKGEVYMRKLLIAILVILMAAMPAAALAETSIAVTGTGNALVPADTGVITLGVNARDEDVLTAQTKVNEAIAAIRAALMQEGVKEEDINTDFINIYAIYDYRNDMEELTGYNVSSNLAIRVEKIDMAGRLIDAAFGAGANTLNGISFSATDVTEAKAEALKKAVQDATTKAEVLAEAAGLKITGIETITEGGTYSYERPMNKFAMMDAAAESESGGTIVQAAKLSVEATVSIVFRVGE